MCNYYYAVLVDHTVAYVGSDLMTAARVLDAKGPSGARMITVASLKELSGIINESPEPKEQEVVDGLSQAAARLFQVLDESGVSTETIEKATQTLKSGGDTVIAQVRSLGIEGMKTVGDGFVALGDLLRKAGEST